MSIRSSFRRAAAAALVAGGLAMVAPVSASAQTETTAPAAPATASTYTVKSGDYLYGIARAHGVGLNALLAANGLSATSIIRPGQVLKIPAPGAPAAAPATPPAASAPSSGASGTYTVRRGDALYAIASRTGTPINTLLSLNGLTMRSVIYPGQVLKTQDGTSSAPAPAAPAPAPAGATGSYTVQRGDSLYGIASKTRTPINTLLSLNGLSLGSVIVPGRVLKTAPGSTPASPAPAPSYQAPSNGLPANSGTGRRLIFSLSQQRVWAVDANGTIVRTWLVSGRLNMSSPGTYSVFSRSSRSYSNADPSITFRYMVRFTKGPNGDNIGFHEIPTRYGAPMQSTNQLGQPISAGCLRQATGDAQFVWNWAPVGTKVVVVR